MTVHDAEWQKTFDAQQKREHDKMMAEQNRLDRAQRAELERKDFRQNAFWWTLGAIIFLTAVVAVAYLWFDSAAGNREKSKLMAQERTEQVAHCAALDNPSERGFCFMLIASRIHVTDTGEVNG